MTVVVTPAAADIVSAFVTRSMAADIMSPMVKVMMAVEKMSTRLNKCRAKDSCGDQDAKHWFLPQL